MSFEATASVRSRPRADRKVGAVPSVTAALASGHKWRCQLDGKNLTATATFLFKKKHILEQVCLQNGYIVIITQFIFAVPSRRSYEAHERFRTDCLAWQR
jgi:hypothetical protein